MRRLWLLLWALWVATPARAQQPSDDYGALIRRAVTEYQAGAWEEARALFRAAHAVEPSARTLRGLALTAYELHHYVACVEEFEAALVHPARPLDAVQRSEAERLVARARGFIATLSLELEPRDAALTIDGAPPVLRDGNVLLDPGVHTLVAEAALHKQVHLQVQVDAGSHRTLRIVLESSAPLTAATPRSQVPPPQFPARAPQATEPPSRRAYAWAFGAGSVALAGAGVGLWFAARETSQDVKRCTLDEAGCASDRQRGQRLERSAYAVAALGVALGGGALGFHWSDKRRTRALKVGFGPQRVWLGGRF